MASWSKYSELKDEHSNEREFDNGSQEELLTPKPKRRRTFNLKTTLVFLGGVAVGVTILVATMPSSLFAKKLPTPSRDGYYVTKIVDGAVIEGTQCGEW